MAEKTELEEIRESQKRLVTGQKVVSELLEKIYAEVSAGGLATQVRFRGDQPEPARHLTAGRGAGGWPESNTGQDRRAFSADH